VNGFYICECESALSGVNVKVLYLGWRWKCSIWGECESALSASLFNST